MVCGRAWSALLIGSLMLCGAAAAASYDAGSSLTVDDPVKLSGGRGEAELLSGIAGFVSSASPSQTTVSLTAQEIWLVHTERASTCPPQAATVCPAPTPSTDEAHVRDVTVTVTAISSSYKLVATNQEAHLEHVEPRGAIIASVASGVLTTNAQALSLSGQTTGWTTGSSASTLYTVPAWTPLVRSAGNSNLGADGNFETLLQGFRVTVRGTDAQSGASFTREYDTASPTSSGEAFLVIEAREGSLKANSPAPVEAFSPDAVKILASTGTAVVNGADGRVSSDGTARAYDGEAATLTGPLAMRDLRVTQGSPARISFTLSSDLTSPTEDDGVRELAMAAAAGASGAGLLAAAAYFWPRLKYALTLLALPLYTRIERTQVLEHSKRDEIYELIRTAPGIHAHEIGERTKIGWGTTVYHLKMLENHSLVVSKKSGRYKRFYVNTGEYTKVKDVYAALRNQTAKNVAEFIVNNPGTSQKDLCTSLGIQPSLASWHVDKLEAVGLVKRVKDGRQVRYFAGPAWSDLNVRLVPGGGAEGVAET